MKIIFGNPEDIKAIDEKYTVLELDTLRFPGSPNTQTAWCLISVENINLKELPTLEAFRNLHRELIKNYRLKNWQFCEDAIDNLRGHWRGELDSFYDEIAQRIEKFKQQDPGSDWDGIYEKTD